MGLVGSTLEIDSISTSDRKRKLCSKNECQIQDNANSQSVHLGRLVMLNKIPWDTLIIEKKS